MTEAIRRSSFKNFWSKFSHRCDNTVMMLNKSADEFEADDRANIISSLPDLHDKDIVDIGAGIGRFTTIFAHDARHVLSCDFIETFMAKNKERNSHFSNISYEVGDAVHLQLEPNSVDLVFTNWLMMYLSDEEVICFLHNALRWLRPNGYLHLRESCSHPSTVRVGGTMHNSAEINPTSYRLSSEYIKLLRSIRYRESDGTLFRFEVHWACSVPTYIIVQNNWRQVHWLTQKVRCDDDEVMSIEHLLGYFSTLWKVEQQKWDRYLDDESYCWTDEVFGYALMKETIGSAPSVLAYNPRKFAYHLHINAHRISETLRCNVVWNVETNEFFYRTSLTKANRLKDQRVRVGWNATLESSLNYWRERGGLFDIFIATEFFTDVDESTIDKLFMVLKADAPLILLEPFDESAYDEKYIMKLLSRYRKLSIEDISEMCTNAIHKYLIGRDLDNNIGTKTWKLIRAHM
uniref:phosphoethanolamine N-methyltransferase n=1 Tax=Parascaris univalens TaxID=6257 RepID=A0A915CI58_PARUN